MDKSRINLLQNAAILLLSLSALVLLLQIISFELGREGSLSDLPGLVTAAGGDGAAADGDELTALRPPFNLMVTSDYGHSGHLLADPETGELELAVSLLREALGSAHQFETVGEDRFRGALSGPGVYFDCLTTLPASLLSAQLSTDLDYQGQARQLLICEEGGDVVLYLRGESAVTRCATALAPSVLQEAVAAFDSNAAFFAFEGGEDYAHLDPYSVLPGALREAPILSAAAPALASDVDQLLTLLDFNPHTMSRYFQSDGTVVVRETTRTLYVRPNGTVSYTGGPQPDSPLYEAAAGEEDPTLKEAVLAVLKLARTLLPEDVIADGALYLSGVEETPEGITVDLQYQVGGIPVYFADDTPAMTARVEGASIVSFTLRYRQYTRTSELYTLLPAALAAAVAPGDAGVFLTAGYIDQGGSTVRPGWLGR